MIQCYNDYNATMITMLHLLQCYIDNCNTTLNIIMIEINDNDTTLIINYH